jgi:large subunit ribosomal protein L18
MATQIKLQNRRKERVRTRIRKEAKGRVRLSVYRSNNNIYAQLIDDAQGKTLASASTVDEAVKAKIKSGGNKDAAKAVGEFIAKKAKDINVVQVVFDRGSYLYHGRVKELAEAARAGGVWIFNYIKLIVGLEDGTSSKRSKSS